MSPWSILVRPGQIDTPPTDARRWWLGCGVVLLVLMAWLVNAGTTRPPAISGVHWLGHSFTAGVAAEGRAPLTVTLPDNWTARGLAPRGRGRYDTLFLLDDGAAMTADAVWALRISALCRQHRIRLNGVLLAETRIDHDPPGKMMDALIDVPSRLLYPGAMNHLSLDVSCAQQGGLSSLALAPKNLLQAGFQRDRILHTVIPLALNMATFAFALFLVMLWWLRGEDASIGLLALISVVVGLSNSAYYVADDLMWPVQFTSWLHYTAYVVACTVFGLFIIAFTREPYPRLKRLWQVSLVLMLGLGAAVAVVDPYMVSIRTPVMTVLMLLALPALWVLLRWARKQSGLSAMGIAAASVPMMGTALHDHYMVRMLGDPDARIWAAMGYPLALPGLYMVLAERFSAVVRQIELSNQTLERRVQERTADLAAANTAKSDFLAAASHDLRQPMVAIGLITGMLRERIREPDIKAMTDRLGEAVESMDDLLRRLLDLSRLEAGAVEVHARTVPLQALFDAIHTHEADPARVKGIGLRLRPTTVELDTDPVLLEQILRNLVGNAVRYTQQGRVLVAARRRAGRCDIEVWDTGVGIAPEDQQRIFGDFVRLATPGRMLDGGLGLGLALVQRAARLIDAQVRVRSQPGRGSCFSVSLPLKAGSAMSRRQRRERARASGWQATVPDRPTAVTPPVATRVPPDDRPLDGVKIVLLEDDRAVRLALERRLVAWGAIVIPLASLSDLDDALQRVHAPSLLVTDLSLGDGTGLQAMERAQQAWPGLRTVIITGDTTSTQLHALARCGAPVLHKPFKVEALLRLLMGDAEPAAADAPMMRA